MQFRYSVIVPIHNSKIKLIDKRRQQKYNRNSNIISKYKKQKEKLYREVLLDNHILYQAGIIEEEDNDNIDQREDGDQYGDDFMYRNVIKRRNRIKRK